MTVYLEDLELCIKIHFNFLLKKKNKGIEGWGLDDRCATSSLNTAEVLIALLQVGLGKNNSSIDEAIRYLITTQQNDGGWRSEIHYIEEESSQTNRTSWAAQALITYGTIESISAASLAYNFLLHRVQLGYWVEYLKGGKPSVTTTCYALLSLIKGYDADGLNDEIKSKIHECISEGITWLYGIQNDDGSFGFFQNDQARPSMSILVSIVALQAKERGFMIGKLTDTIQWVLGKLDNSDKTFLGGDIEVENLNTMGIQYEHFTSALLVRLLFSEGIECNDVLRQTYLEHLVKLKIPGGGCGIGSRTRVFFYTTAHALIALSTARDWLLKNNAKVPSIEDNAKGIQFEKALTCVKSICSKNSIKAKKCFISYAWGVFEHERWVSKLVEDLKNAGINVTFDQKDNAFLGSDVQTFISNSIEESDFIIVVGTPLYKEKYENKAPYTGSKVALEVKLIGIRLSEENNKKIILPLLLSGDENNSLPLSMRGRVYGNFKNEDAYFKTLLDLILTLYSFPFDNSTIRDLRLSMQGDENRKK